MSYFIHNLVLKCTCMFHFNLISTINRLILVHIIYKRTIKTFKLTRHLYILISQQSYDCTQSFKTLSCTLKIMKPFDNGRRLYVNLLLQTQKLLSKYLNFPSITSMLNMPSLFKSAYNILNCFFCKVLQREIIFIVLTFCPFSKSYNLKISFAEK